MAWDRFVGGRTVASVNELVCRGGAWSAIASQRNGADMIGDVSVHLATTQAADRLRVARLDRPRRSQRELVLASLVLSRRKDRGASTDA